jgi:glycine oxidase
MSSVLVIGAGVVGAAIAEELAVRGARVSVLDMRAPGRGASQASAGILAPFIESHGDATLLELGRRSLALYDAFVQRASRESGRRIEYARSGTLQVALNEAEAGDLASSKQHLDAAGIEARWLDRAALAAFEPAVTRSATAALFTPAHAFVGVSDLVTALVTSARFAGASFENAVEAVEIDPGRDEVTVRAGGREYHADEVVVAAGSWTSRVRIKGATPPPVRPVRGQLLHLQWPAQALLPQPIVWGSGCYTVPWSDGTLLVGATVEEVGFDEHSTVEGVRDLSAAVSALLPDAARASIESVKVGLRPALPDRLPAIGTLARAPRVMMATGHFRNGVLLAPVTAKLVAGAIIDGIVDPILASTSPDRFEREKDSGNLLRKA